MDIGAITGTNNCLCLFWLFRTLDVTTQCIIKHSIIFIFTDLHSPIYNNCLDRDQYEPLWSDNSIFILTTDFYL